MFSAHKVDININGIVRFRINDYDRALNKMVVPKIFDEYINYVCDSSINEDDLDFIINIKRDMHFNNNCYIVDDDFYINSHHLFTKDSYKLAKWSIEIDDVGELLEININPNLFARFFISGFFIDFIIQLFAAKKGFPLIHSSGVCSQDDAFLFAGRGGSGKTSVVTHLMERNPFLSYLGDDFIFINNGNAIPYITPLNLFSYNLSSSILVKMGSQFKYKLFIRKLLYRLTGGYAKFFIKINPKKLYRVRNKPSNIKKIFVIIPKLSNQFSSTQIDRDSAISYLVNNMRMDSQIMPRYLLEYSFIFPNHDISIFWEQYERMIKDSLSNNITFYKISFPILAKKAGLNEVEKLII